MRTDLDVNLGSGEGGVYPKDLKIKRKREYRTSRYRLRGRDKKKTTARSGRIQHLSTKKKKVFLATRPSGEDAEMLTSRRRYRNRGVPSSANFTSSAGEKVGTSHRFPRRSCERRKGKVGGRSCSARIGNAR